MSDVFTDSLNAPAGQLTAVLLKKMTKGERGEELPNEMRERFDKLVGAHGRFGQLARVRLAAEVSFLFERAPGWTKEKIIPLFDWSLPEAPAAWAARKYSRYIGSPELFGLLKQPFLELFKRDDIPDEELSIFADWLAAIMIANQSDKRDYPITATEARSALRDAGVKSLPHVGHRLAIEMESAKPDEKIPMWREVIGPVFQAIWPLDVELQNAESTFKLVQLLRATGKAFPEAADVIIPFIRAEDPRQHTSVFSISNADDILYASSPEKMLDLLQAIVGDTPARRSYGLGKALERIRAHAPHLADSKKFQKLVSVASAD
jgi:hypothetical protein